MKTNLHRTLFCKPILSSFSLVFLLSICACENSPMPPRASIVISTFYKTASGADLLNSRTPNAYKEKDLKVISKVEERGVIKLRSYNQDGVDSVGIFIDDQTGFNYIELAIPTKAAVLPLETYIYLSPTKIDTATYTFEGSRFGTHIPDKIFYNKKLVWEVSKTPLDGNWPPITIVRN